MHKATQRQAWDKNILSTQSIAKTPHFEVLHIVNKGAGAFGVQKRDFFEKKYVCEGEKEVWYYFSSIPDSQLSIVPPRVEKDTTRAMIYLGLHRFTEGVQNNERVLTATFFLQCDLRVRTAA